MSAATVEHVEPWTEDDYLALGETQQRIELIDGGLLVSPGPAIPHQLVVHRLADALEAAAPSGWLVVEGGNVHVGPSRILIPDVLVTDAPLDTLVAPAAGVPFVAEVVSPSSKAQDRMFKPQLYAAAGIPWYLRVELHGSNTPELVLHRLVEGAYAQRAHVRAGDTLTITGPFTAEIDPATLLPR